MNQNEEQAGAPTPNTHTITGSTLRLLQACATMAGKTIEEVVLEWATASFVAEFEDAFLRSDAAAVLVAAEVDPELTLEVRDDPEQYGRTITIEEGRRLLAENPEVRLRAFRPYTPRTTEAA